MTDKKLIPQNYYRLPWSLTDNGISWLEVTDACNLACEGCYRPHINKHKTLKEIEEDLMVFKAKRKSDCISIAGGDPLMHPQIVDIVKMIKSYGWKPILNTNGVALNLKLLRALKNAGVAGFTFHIDTTQVRADSPASLEKEHNHLRLKLAKMLAAEGGISCSFNQTVSIDTIDQIPDVVEWAKKHPDIVHTIVFILFRSPKLTGDFDFWANGKKINLTDTYEKTSWGGKKLLTAQDVVNKIRTVEPLYEPNGYLNGSCDPDSFKWLLSTRVASMKETFGYAGPRFMEIVQHVYHFLYGRWISYSSPGFLNTGRSSAILFSLFDKKMRSVLKNMFLSIFKNPFNIFRTAYMQTFTIIQPVDMMSDGRMNMCDSCPDITAHKGELYWSCRLEEIKEFGCFVNAVPKSIVRNEEEGLHDPKIPITPANNNIEIINVHAH